MIKHEAHRTGLPSFRVITLNASHGRKLKSYQAYFRRRTVERHLSEIAFMLKRERPDVVGLQEIDGNSCLSGGFDHAAHLAGLGDFAHFFLGEHVSVGRTQRIAYGTAILSRLPLKNLKSVTFGRRFAGFTKGFVVATISPRGAPHLEVDVVSVHLAFLRRKARQKQVAAMTFGYFFGMGTVDPPDTFDLARLDPTTLHPRPGRSNPRTPPCSKRWPRTSSRAVTTLERSITHRA